jgi:hypothetical protein
MKNHTRERKVITPLAKPKQKGRRPRESQVGEKMIDGSIYAGVSPTTGKRLYTTPTDAPLTDTFNEAKVYATKLDAHGHGDWRIPSKAELKILFNNRAAIGGFSESGEPPIGWYRSSSPSPVGHPLSDGYVGSTWCQRFDDGYQDYPNFALEYLPTSLRCVR